MNILRLPGLVQTKQPRGDVTLDLNNPFARNTKLLLASVVGKYLMQPLVGCGPNTGQGFGEAGHSKVITPQGIFTATAGGGYGDSTSTADYIIDRIGIIAFASFFKIGSASTSVVTAGGVAGANDCKVILNSNSTLTVTANADYTFTSAALADGFHTVVFSNMRAAGKQSLWVDGVLVDSSGTSTGQQGFTSNSTGCGVVSSGSNVAIGMVGVMLGGPSMAGDFAKFFAVYPWGLLKRNTRQLVMLAAGISAAALSGTSISSVSSSGALTTAVKLAGTSQTSSISLGGITTAVQLAGTSKTNLISSGALLTGIPLIGISGTPVLSSGALTTAISLAGTSRTSSAGSGTLLSASISLTGSSNTPTFSSGVLTTAIKLAGTSASSAKSSGALVSNAAALAGTSTTSAFSGGALLTGIRLTGTSRTLSVSSGGINTLPIVHVIPAAQSVVFAGGTNQVVFDGGTNRVVFDGGTTKAVFAADITRVIFDGGINKVTF